MAVDLSKARLQILREARGMAQPFRIEDGGVPFNLPEENPTEDQVAEAIEAEMADVYLTQQGDQWGRRDLGTIVEENLESLGTANIGDRLALSILEESRFEMPHVEVTVEPGQFRPSEAIGRVKVRYRPTDRQRQDTREAVVGDKDEEEQN